MADYMVGRSGSSKDRFMVGWNGSKNTPYKVGGSQTQIASKDNGSLGGGDQASPAGAKSQFAHTGDDAGSLKQIGDESPNMNFGGAIKVGLRAGSPTEDYAEKGDWSDEKNAMARRKAMMDAASQYSAKGAQYKTPVADIIADKLG